MGIDLILVGKTDSAEIAALMADYSKRISRYARFSVVFLPDVRNAGKLPVQIQKQAEGEMILRQTAPGDYVVLLDEKGTEMRSVEFAAWLGGKLTGSARRICFIVGGPKRITKRKAKRRQQKDKSYKINILWDFFYCLLATLTAKKRALTDKN